MLFSISSAFNHLNAVTSTICRRKIASLTSKSDNLILKDIVQRIKINGPISVAEYMRIVLTVPRDGFYMKQDVFGTKGHFTTSPEITQIFGELIAVWLISQWQRFGCPKPFRIIELGPGRGTLASDISRVVAQISTSRNETSLHLVEVSPHLTMVQHQTITGQQNDSSVAVSKHGIPVAWYRNLEELTPTTSGFNAFVANEFFDALPVHKFQKNEMGTWVEIMVGLESENKLKFITTRGETPASKAYIKESLSNFNHIEVCPDGGLLCDKITNIMDASRNGCFLICDYGFNDTDVNDRDTFRAFHKHKQCHPLQDPGDADLTADVDFGYLRRIAEEKSIVYGPVNQSDFLTQLGIGLRLEKLLEKAESFEERQNLISGVDKVVNEMGQRFKFLSMFPKCYKEYLVDNPPAGFECLEEEN